MQCVGLLGSQVDLVRPLRVWEADKSDNQVWTHKLSSPTLPKPRALPILYSSMDISVFALQLYHHRRDMRFEDISRL
jgi:hypothetical protein